MNHVISDDGTLITYDVTGFGPALVLVDGAFCHRKYGVTPALVPLLSGSFTIYSYDRRGRGDSSDTRPYSVEKEIDDLTKIIEKAGGRPYICGFSSGAALVLLALGRGIRAGKAALFEPPYVAGSTDGKRPPHDAEIVLKDLINVGKRSEAVKYFMTKVMGMPAIIVFLIRLFGKSIWRNNKAVANTLAYDVAVMGDYEVPEKAASGIHVPAAVIGGEKSPMYLKAAAEAVSRSIPGSQVIWLKGESHNVSMKVLAPSLTSFFTGKAEKNRKQATVN